MSKFESSWRSVLEKLVARPRGLNCLFSFPVVLALLGLGYCSSHNKTAPEGLERGTSADQSKWFVFGGNGGAYLPCECKAYPSGGLVRRHNFLKKYNALGYRVVSLDTGNNLFPATLSLPKGAEWNESSVGWKEASLQLFAAESDGVAAYNVASGDLLLGVEAFRKLTEKSSLPFVSANVKLKKPALWLKPYVDLLVDGQKYRLTGLARAPLSKKFRLVGYSLERPVLALKRLFKNLPSDSRLVVLSDMDADELAKIAKSLSFPALFLGSTYLETYTNSTQLNDLSVAIVNPASGRFFSEIEIHRASSDLAGEKLWNWRHLKATLLAPREPRKGHVYVGAETVKTFPAWDTENLISKKIKELGL